MGISTLRQSSGFRLGNSRFVIAFLAAFLVGIFFGDKISFDFGWAAGIIFGLIIATIIFWPKQYYRLGIIVFLGLILGLTYYHFWDWKENRKELVYGNQLEILGMISGKPEITDNQKIILRYNNTKILVFTEKFPQYQYGDKLKIQGTIKNPAQIKPFNSFDYGNYLLKKNIRGIIYNPEKIEKEDEAGNPILKAIYFVGDKFEESLNRILPEPYAAFQAGLILGVKRNIPDSLISDFNRTGTTHIIAVSGYNVTIIIMFLAFVLMRFSRRWSFYGSILAIVIFVILTGAVASVLRAGVLTALVLLAKYIGRRPYYPVLLLTVAFLMLLFNPYALKNDISFQLSFLAFIGLIYLAPKISNFKVIKMFPQTVKTAFSETMGAQIMVLPILLYQFGILSIVAPLANILILPVVPTTMLLGFLAGAGGLIWLYLGKILGIIAWILLKYIIVVVQFLSSLPFAAINLKTSDWWWMPIYFLIIFWWAQKKRTAESEIS